MKILAHAVLLGSLGGSALCGAERVVELVPWQKLGPRGNVEFKEAQWQAECPWFGREVLVYQAADREAASTEFIAPLAKRLEFTQSAHRNGVEHPNELVTVYEGPPAPNGSSVLFQRGHLAFYPHLRKLRLVQRGLWTVPRDEILQPKIDNPPEREACYAKSLEWLEQLGVQRAELFPKADDVLRPFGAYGESTKSWYERTSLTEADITKPRSVVYQLSVVFYQKVGDLRATGWGVGGKVRFTFVERNRPKLFEYALREWEPMAAFSVLDRAEIEDALRSGFAFGVPPLKCEKLKITEVELLAACMPPDEPQRHATPLYQLRVTAEGGPMDGTTESLFIPALRIHRHAYDDPPREEDGKEPAPPP